MEIRGKNALVTGAAKRVGREIALAFAKKGANVLLHYRSSHQEALETAAAIRSLGVRCDLFSADLSAAGGALKLAREIRHAGLAVDILVNSASLFYKTPLNDTNEHALDELMSANFKGPFFLSKEIGNQMAAAGGGTIINIADWSGLRPYKNYAAYCASKGALITFTKSLARELAPKVTANAVAPGPVLLPDDFTEEEKKSIEKLTLLGRIGSPSDVANAAVFLAGSRFINGAVLVVDGGRSMM
ncbi:MAG: SDR family oxidoreductase [Candidatus Omnitrophica bacterium]|nr:SDR family oxidoreductase [Candidatus Omnitrophota bacterium]